MRIAVIEDETPIREGMAKILQKIKPGYEVVGTAKDGAEGLELVRNIRPDLIIMDIRMPKMTGLEMLAKIRQEKIMCKAIVLSAYSDFNYAKQAIELGIENYLLKPIRIAELKWTLQDIENKLTKSHSQERVFSLENIFTSCVNGQLQPDEAFHVMTQHKYGFTVNDRAEILTIWLGSGYEKQKDRVKQLVEKTVQKDRVKHLMEKAAGREISYSVYVQKADAWKLLICVFYRLSAGTSLFPFYQKTVIPEISSGVEQPIVCVWKESEKILNLPDDLKDMKALMEWGLIFGPGKIINKEEIQKLSLTQLRYPIELEENAKKALFTENKSELVKIYEKLFEYYQQNLCSPAEMKNSLIRFNLALVKANEEYFAESALEIQNIFRRLSSVVCWQEIDTLMEKFFHIMNIDSSTMQGETLVSGMVQKAQQLIKKYYDQGITLEEIAGKLFVSEEYLSSQFKKETGMTFTETVRKYRIEKVKKLLLETHLKLNQIAVLAGYSDPKYMSKVFKEEVGMLPNEYRKSVH